jgi:hypothetical protein
MNRGKVGPLKGIRRRGKGKKLFGMAGDLIGEPIIEVYRIINIFHLCTLINRILQYVTFLKYTGREKL